MKETNVNEINLKEANEKEQNAKKVNAKEPNAKEPNAKEPNAKEPNAKEPNAKEPNAKELNVKELNVKEITGKETNGKAVDRKAIDRSRKRKGPLMLLALFCLLCSLLFLCLPAVWVHMQDVAVLSRELPRPAEEGALAERAREIPIVYALYRRRYLAQSGYFSFSETGEGTALLQEKTTGLIQAGILPEATARHIQELLEMMPADIDCKADGDFSAIRQTYWDGQFIASEVMLYWHTDTGLVVSLQASIDASAADAKELLRQYRAYLGVETLGDWTDLESKDEAAAACWSPTGQLYLYCSAKQTELVLGAISVSREEIDETFLQ